MFLAFMLAAASLAGKVEFWLEKNPALRRAHWGVHAVRADTGEVVYSHNADRLFTPASNTKLFSTALAMRRLGPPHKFVTRVMLDPNGDLRLVGGGDVTMSSRPIPYVHRAPPSDPLAALDSLAAKVAASGIDHVSGNIVGDDSAYLWEPYPEGWALDDTLWEYGAPVSALVLHDNYFSLRLAPGGFSISPPSSYFTVDFRPRIVCCGPNKASVRRQPGSRHLEVGGDLSRPAPVEVAVEDPAHYAAFAFREALQARGVRVDGEPAVKHRFPGNPPEGGEQGREIARRESPQLIEILKTINKVSQNLQAEVILREVARQGGAEPSLAGGLAELKRFLTEIGVPEDAYHLDDGSGLSRRTLVAPAAIVHLLRHMNRPEWRELMPIGGEDGTLAYRFRDLKAGTVLAKTGTLTHVSALSGYAQDSRGDWIVFSVLVNHAKGPAGIARAFIDNIVVGLLE
jgi:D-alanyl-D-alanine carboxypeptidase/D-alanyl-D-alanine-endopeptidase (penicillin-binding protein 4)